MNVITLHIEDQSACAHPGIAGFRNYSIIGWEWWGIDGQPNARKEHRQWPHAPRNTMPTTLITMARNAGTPRFAMTAMWIIFTTVISTMCTKITWTNMSSRSTPQIR
jgi:hypothetical protein